MADPYTNMNADGVQMLKSWIKHGLAYIADDGAWAWKRYQYEGEPVKITYEQRLREQLLTTWMYHGREAAVREAKNAGWKLEEVLDGYFDKLTGEWIP